MRPVRQPVQSGPERACNALRHSFSRGSRLHVDIHGLALQSLGMARRERAAVVIHLQREERMVRVDQVDVVATDEVHVGELHQVVAPGNGHQPLLQFEVRVPDARHAPDDMACRRPHGHAFVYVVCPNHSGLLALGCPARPGLPDNSASGHDGTHLQWRTRWSARDDGPPLHHHANAGAAEPHVLPGEREAPGRQPWRTPGRHRGHMGGCVPNVPGRRCTMLLELSAVEARDVKQALDTALRALLEEMAHADPHAHRDLLRERYERLDQLNRRLDMSLEGEQVYA
ncbi:hypothetical protein MXAN_7223 [Myxococcus xanthus DK 1622]|uniref:Uncharacterized protein n=2 Tax=Myxococcaceae TaxID=31 RepID=Q1CW87_MYXXD|nr:hypothetical protein MXAN_7223 [Myxococcus xanthus DK 1622]